MNLGADSAIDDGDHQFTINNASLELEPFIVNHKGYGKLIRLMFIAEHCPTLEVEALKMAVQSVQETHNTMLYVQIHKKLVSAMKRNSNLPDALAGLACTPLDNQWLDSKQKAAEMKLAKIDDDLKGFKHSSVKESIRRGYCEMGTHYLDWGKLQEALKSFMRMKDYNTNPSHSLFMCSQVIIVSIYQKCWLQAITYVKKAELEIEHQTTKISKEQSSKQASQFEPRTVSLVRCAAGLSELGRHEYKTAARCFLEAQFDHCEHNELLTTNDVAKYGTLCALATFDRNELQKSVIKSGTFKLFLEPEPNIREILFAFNNSQYSKCLSIMESIKDSLMLDMYLSPHVNYLYSRIRRTALCQYFNPYMTADLKLMAAAFNSAIADIENELMELILEGRIGARIDSHNKILIAQDINSRQQTYEKAIAAGQEYQKTAAHILLRAAVIKAGVSVGAE